MNGIPILLGLCLGAFAWVGSLSAQQSVAPPLQQPSRAEAIPAETPAEAVNKNNSTTTPEEGPGGKVINSAANDYVLTTADTLEMSIFHEPDLATRSKIGSDGSVQLPLIGDTKVAGMTVRDARELIRKLYDARYLVKPQVYLNVVDYAQKKFTILGQVAKAGTYELPGGGTLSLLEAVGLAGGFTRSADRAKVSIQRTTDSQRETILINAKKLSGEGQSSFLVQPGDVITVPETWF